MEVSPVLGEAPEDEASQGSGNKPAQVLGEPPEEEEYQVSNEEAIALGFDVELLPMEETIGGPMEETIAEGFGENELLYVVVSLLLGDRIYDFLKDARCEKKCHR